MNIISLNQLKWLSTALILFGIFLTNLNYYPLNIFSHGLGAIGWSVAGYITKDKALLTNFGLQLPLFALGYYNYFLI
ncbi:MAG: hypothetical protein CFH14_01132 [Alphaproteobacteria bacterium MarineAlpha5_Bin4]|nr:MAG: hypothetical protein CFH14_01132 [Alphaproteobacteria bacterium MarineAlpha5_Bin4]